MAKSKKEMIETGLRYAEIDVEAGLVRRVHVEPLRQNEDGTTKSVSRSIPDGHIMVVAPISLGLIINRPIKGIEVFEKAVAEEKKAAKEAASKASKPAATKED